MQFDISVASGLIVELNQVDPEFEFFLPLPIFLFKKLHLRYQYHLYIITVAHKDEGGFNALCMIVDMSRREAIPKAFCTHSTRMAD